MHHGHLFLGIGVADVHRFVAVAVIAGDAAAGGRTGTGAAGTGGHLAAALRDALHFGDDQVAQRLLGGIVLGDDLRDAAPGELLAVDGDRGQEALLVGQHVELGQLVALQLVQRHQGVLRRQQLAQRPVALDALLPHCPWAKSMVGHLDDISQLYFLANLTC